ncbi:hypothetical protein GF336_00185 [Candidatus Woesearchaeota archaeon]|nr:hypothetical protein [Candidatus Woesearchaeota archaeon]
MIERYLDHYRNAYMRQIKNNEIKEGISIINQNMLVEKLNKDLMKSYKINSRQLSQLNRIQQDFYVFARLISTESGRQLMFIKKDLINEKKMKMNRNYLCDREVCFAD